MQQLIASLHRALIVVRAQFHFFILYALVISLMCDWAEIYRAFQYLNFIAVGVYFYRGYRLSNQQMWLVLTIPVGFMVLHMLAVGKFELVKDARHLWLASFVTLGVCCLARHDLVWVIRNRVALVIGLLYFYILAQFIGFTFFEGSYGAMRNPHYLSFYSAMGAFIGISQLHIKQNLPRFILIVAVVVMGGFVLYSSSRPAWIALILSSLLWSVCMPNRKKVLFVLLVPVLLFVTNAGGFADRLVELASHIADEERVIIWADSLKMQQASSWWAWFFGHGIDSFVDDFAAYTHFKVVFHSQHNSILEVIYISGLLGLLLFVGLYAVLFLQLYKFSFDSTYDRQLIIIIIAALVFHMLMIFLTVPLFSPYNMYPLAFIGGICLYMGEKGGRSRQLSGGAS